MPRVSAPTLATPTPTPKAGLPTLPTLPSLLPTPSMPFPAATASTIIPNSHFQIIDRVRHKAVILVFGDGGCGKTTFGAKYAPQPAVLIGFDGRSQYVEMEQKLAGTPIPAVYIPPPSVLQKSENVKSAAKEALNEFFYNFSAAIEASKAGKVATTIIDTASELGEIITLSVRGTLDAIKGDYGRSKDQINQIWWKIFGAARYQGNANLVLLARASSIWVNNEPTGDFKARVTDVVRDAVDFAVHIRWATSTIPVDSAGLPIMPVMPTLPMVGASAKPKSFELVVTKAGNQRSELGAIYSEADWEGVGPFAYACSKLMPGTTPDDWR